MLLSLAAMAVLQGPPPAVRVPQPSPGSVSARPAVPAGATLFDGFEAWRRVAAAYAALEEPERVEPDVHRRADAALDVWQQGDRRAAVEGWTRLALQLDGSQNELDLVAAALRLECVDGGQPTRIRRGFFSSGGFSSPTSLRVRLLFDLPELAGRDLGAGVGLLRRVDELLGPSERPEERTQFPIVFDEAGRWPPFEAVLQIGHMGFWDCAFELCLDGNPIERIVMSNDGGVARSRASLWRQAFADGDPPTQETLNQGPNGPARRAFASRVALIVEAADLERSAEFTIGQRTPGEARIAGPYPMNLVYSYASTLASEAERLSDGSPYRAAMGAPLWRTFVHGNEDIPAWVFVPAQRGERPPPLVVLLHEPGFDEGWARFVAGGGSFFAQAARHGVALLAPQNAALAEDPSALASLVAGIQSEIAVDHERLVLVAPHGARELAARLVSADTSVGIELRSLTAPLGDDTPPIPGVGRVLGLERAFDALLRSLETK
jgi:hypothetical protein